MNERIKQLADHARSYALDEKRHFEYIHRTEQCMEEYREVYNTKFAELIILECEKVSKNKKWYSESPFDSWRNPIEHVCRNFKEHFGVD